jgi:hypothetical protein
MRQRFFTGGFKTESGASSLSTPAIDYLRMLLNASIYCGTMDKQGP